MINDVIISKLDELIGDFNTPFFNYLIYSYDFSFKECELIIDDIKTDITNNKVSAGNLISTVESYFKAKSVDLEKHSKLDYLDEIIQEDSDFFLKYLKKYDLNSDDIHIIYTKVRERILNENPSDFEIKRDLEYYFSNSVKQSSYLKNLNWIKGKNYDTLIIRKAKKNYPILRESDIRQVIFSINSDIIGAFDFKRTIKEEFLHRCMLKNENKKTRALSNLEALVEGKGDSFSILLRLKNLSKKDGEKVILEIKNDILSGLIQPDQINGVFLTKRFNEYNERK